MQPLNIAPSPEILSERTGSLGHAGHSQAGIRIVLFKGIAKKRKWEGREKQIAPPYA